MKRGTLAAVLAGAAAIVGVTALTTAGYAHGPGRDGAGLSGHMGQMGMQGGMMMGGQHRMRMFEMLDTNSDGAVGEEEGRAAILEQLTSFDSDGDRSLSLEEFDAMHAAHMRPHMVDRFQFHDDDGDGKVTADEMTAPFGRMMQWMDRNGDGQLSPDDMHSRVQGHGMGMMRDRN